MADNKISHAENIVRLRQRIREAVTLGVISKDNYEPFELMLLQIMNETERQRIQCHKIVQEYEQKIKGAQSQASAYEAMTSIVYGILNSLIRNAEKDKDEIQELEEQEEQAENEDVSEEVIKNKASKKKRSKRK